MYNILQLITAASECVDKALAVLPCNLAHSNGPKSFLFDLVFDFVFDLVFDLVFDFAFVFVFVFNFVLLDALKLRQNLKSNPFDLSASGVLVKYTI